MTRHFKADEDLKLMKRNEVGRSEIESERWNSCQRARGAKPYCYLSACVTENSLDNSEFSVERIFISAFTVPPRRDINGSWTSVGVGTTLGMGI